MRTPIAAICASHTCNAKLHEGTSALYDECRDQHFCDADCFSEWFGYSIDKIAVEYRRANVSRCDL